MLDKAMDNQQGEALSRANPYRYLSVQVADTIEFLGTADGNQCQIHAMPWEAFAYRERTGAMPPGFTRLPTKCQAYEEGYDLYVDAFQKARTARVGSIG